MESTKRMKFLYLLIKQSWLPCYAALVTMLHLYFNSLSTLSELKTSLIHFGTLGFLVAIKPSLKEKNRKTQVSKTGVLLGITTIICCTYLILNEEYFYARGQEFNQTDWLFSGLIIICSLELSRRASGWTIPLLAIIAITYIGFWGNFVQGMLNFPGLSWETILYRATYSGDGMFGSLARISWSYIFMFILFGTFLLKTGASEIILNIARSSTKHITGGPGIVAVLSSGLMGSVSGSAIGNTVSTGSVTIPLMKKTGFSPTHAAGIEAAASTGGQLMPPVMGAGAFLMANYTGADYLTIITAATLPAVLYFLSITFHVRILAKKFRIKTEKEVDINSKNNFKKNWQSLLPVFLLIALLIAGYTPTWCAAASTGLAIVCARYGPKPLSLNDIGQAFLSATSNAATISVLLIAVGLLVMSITTTGIGTVLSQMIGYWSDGSLLVTLLLISLTSLILGLGIPVTASYVILAPLAVPALMIVILEFQLIDFLTNNIINNNARVMIETLMPDIKINFQNKISQGEAVNFINSIPQEFKFPIMEQILSPAAISSAILCSHMIIFWLSQDSNVTPPVCLAAYAAAGIAGASPFKSGLAAWKFAKGLYLIPVVMAFYPLIGGNALELFQISLFTLASLYCLAASLNSYLEGPIKLPVRILITFIGLYMIWPSSLLLLKLLALIILAILIYISRRDQKLKGYLR